MPQDRGLSSDDDQQGVNLVPPEEGCELYGHKDAENLKTKNWPGYYRARPKETGGYEVQGVRARIRGEALDAEGHRTQVVLLEALRTER